MTDRLPASPVEAATAIRIRTSPFGAKGLTEAASFVRLASINVRFRVKRALSIAVKCPLLAKSGHP